MLEIVPFDASHVSTFTRWFNALPNNDVWTEDWIHYKCLDDEKYDPALMIAAEENGDPVGFLLGSIANEAGWIRAFLVRPDRQRQGIGTTMFEAVERTFLARGIQEVNVGWAFPKYLLPGVDIAYTVAIAFLDRRGYETNRETRVNMNVLLAGRNFDTAEKEARLHENGIAIRRAHPRDRPNLKHLCEVRGNPIWVIETGMALEREPVTVFIAEKAGAICAFAAHSICGPIHFGPMLTASELRGLGIGTVLLKRCLQDWQRAGVERCEIVWAGPLSFYARTVGATTGRAFWVWHRSLTEG